MKLNSQARPILPTVSPNNNNVVLSNLNSFALTAFTGQSGCVPSQCGMFTNNLGERPRLNNLG